MARRFPLVIISIYFYFHIDVNIHLHVKIFLLCLCVCIVCVWYLKYVQFHEFIRPLSNTNISIYLFMFKCTGINMHTHIYAYIHKWHAPPHKACQGASISHPNRHVWLIGVATIRSALIVLFSYVHVPSGERALSEHWFNKFWVESVAIQHRMNLKKTCVDGINVDIRVI